MLCLLSVSRRHPHHTCRHGMVAVALSEQGDQLTAIAELSLSPSSDYNLWHRIVTMAPRHQAPPPSNKLGERVPRRQHPCARVRLHDYPRLHP